LKEYVAPSSATTESVTAPIAATLSAKTSGTTNSNATSPNEEGATIETRPVATHGAAAGTTAGSAEEGDMFLKVNVLKEKGNP